MDWIADGEEVRERLMRIVALLLSLGVLAERACRAPLPVRVRVMGFLRPAESVAWDFVAGDAALREPAGEGDDPAAAMRLAGRFHALAVALAAFAGRFGGRCRVVHIGILSMAAAAARDFADADRGGLQPFDTS